MEGESEKKKERAALEIIQCLYRYWAKWMNMDVPDEKSH